jgi:hypothetical protein
MLTELFEVTGTNNKPYCSDKAQAYSLWLRKKLKAHYIILERREQTVYKVSKFVINKYSVIARPMMGMWLVTNE